MTDLTAGWSACKSPLDGLVLRNLRILARSGKPAELVDLAIGCGRRYDTQGEILAHQALIRLERRKLARRVIDGQNGKIRWVPMVPKGELE